MAAAERECKMRKATELKSARAEVNALDKRLVEVNKTTLTV